METNKILKKEQFLLQKKDNLFLNRILLQDRIKELEEEIKPIKSEIEIYKKIRKKIVNKYINNSFQVIGTIAIVDLPTHILSNNYDSLSKFDYVVIGSTIYILSLLTFDLVNELKEYRKNNKLDTKDVYYDALEKMKLEVINSLKDNDLKIDSTMSELDEVYDKLLPKELKKERSY